MKRRVVVTGMGALTPIGNTAFETWQAAKEGKCGIAPITLFDASDLKAHLAGEVKNFVPEDYMDKKESRKMDRYAQLGVAAASEAFTDSGLNMEKEDPYRCGVILSSGIGGMETLETEHARGEQKGFNRISPYFIPMCISNMGAAHIAIQHGLKGPCGCTVTACASGSDALGSSFRQIRDGYIDVMLCGGAEAAITPLGIGGFIALRALSLSEDPNRASIPFDKERNGFIMGEGSGVLVLEELEHAKTRGAKIYGEVVGYAATCDAYHITAPAPKGEGSAVCMSQALQDAGLQPQEIDYINAHGTATPLNDSCETAAIKTAFGDYAKKVMVSSTKSMMGHLLGAGGAVEAILCLSALKDEFVPATINYQVPDEECDLDVVPNKGRPAKIRYALSNSIGFGGHNASLIFKRWEEA